MGEVVAHIAGLEDRIAELEAELRIRSRETSTVHLEARIVELEAELRDQREETSTVRLEAFRLLTTAREDAEAMVEEARKEAARILDEARGAATGGEAPPPLDPRLETIKAELSAARQRAFYTVASRRKV